MPVRKGLAMWFSDHCIARHWPSRDARLLKGSLGTKAPGWKAREDTLPRRGAPLHHQVCLIVISEDMDTKMALPRPCLSLSYHRQAGPYHRRRLAYCRQWTLPPVELAITVVDASLTTVVLAITVVDASLTTVEPAVTVVDASLTTVVLAITVVDARLPLSSRP